MLSTPTYVFRGVLVIKGFLNPPTHSPPSIVFPNTLGGRVESTLFWWLSERFVTYCSYAHGVKGRCFVREACVQNPKAFSKTPGFEKGASEHTKLRIDSDSKLRMSACTSLSAGVLLKPFCFRTQAYLKTYGFYYRGTGEKVQHSLKI